MSREAATQSAVNAVAVATAAINEYGEHSTEAQGALQAARDSVTTAREQGATDADFRAVRPQ
ncbi:hypothetical protein [Streptomyces sp. NPDC060322]|uniref:hypothetical protein n=1 Tax=Streptomyces sp. NPDC060322 TaxID=3347097 RepID=UPI003667C6CD